MQPHDKLAFNFSVSWFGHDYGVQLYTHTVPWWGKSLRIPAK